MAKKQDFDNEVMGQVESTGVEQNVIKLTDWKQLKKKNEETMLVPMEYPDGTVIGVEINALSKATLNALNEKYEELKGVPEKVFNKDTKKFELAPKNSVQYKEWENKGQALDNLKAAETIITALVIKPEGDTLEEQADFLQSVFKSGQHDKLFMEILKFSGYDFASQIDNAKNS